jgi:hypothetical protein
VPKLIPTRVVVETGTKRAFASALDWPGWSRAGRDEGAALEALAAYGTRFAPVAAAAGVPFPSTAASRLQVVEHVPGSATTDFGAPGSIAEAEYVDLTPAEARRRADLVRAAWAALDQVVSGAPARLRKGPRGGGRDRDAIAQHVCNAEAAYARKLGLKLREPDALDAVALDAFRIAVDDALRDAHRRPAGATGWPPSYAARRIAWHALDHAWEIEDRST